MWEISTARTSRPNRQVCGPNVDIGVHRNIDTCGLSGVEIRVDHRSIMMVDGYVGLLRLKILTCSGALRF